MSTSVEWRGALSIVGINVNVALHKPARQSRNESFRMLGPDGMPVRRVYIDSDDNILTSDEIQRGVQVAKDQFKAMTPEALEQIESMTRTEVVEPAYFCPIGTVDMTKALTTYAVTADDNVPGAERSVAVLWNGLRANELALCSQFSKRGAMDSVLVVWADRRGLWATEMRFAGELYEQPTVEFEVDETAELTFARIAEAGAVETRESFDLSAFKSEYKMRRESAIESVLKGEPVRALPGADETPADADLMAALTARLEESA